MVGKDGSVRVMDFGLARLLREDLLDTGSFAREVREAVASDDQTATHATIRTGDGTLLGTPAYMAPEQWRGEATDARADQFSFCVALHEALYGARPALSHLRGESRETGSGAMRRAGTPVWLRGVLARGLSTDKEKRYGSMDQLLAALTRGRTRGQRRFVGLAAGLTVALLAVGAWRLSHARRFDCQPPAERLAAAWSPDSSDQRRQAVQAAVLGSGHPQAATAWQQISSGLDAYIGHWHDMYKETCEATHVRGEQSEEVLDLRMRCLTENLDDVRALTTVLATTDRASVGRGITAVRDLTPVARCADVGVLRSAVPLPRDEKTLRSVQTLQLSIKEIQALDDLGHFKAGMERAVAIRRSVESTGYKPLLADLAYLLGELRWQLDDTSAAAGDFKESLVLGVETNYELVAAKAAAALIGVTGLEDRYQESDLWWSLANAFLQHKGPDQDRVRSWAMQNRGIVFSHLGDFESARDFFQRALVLKEEVLGPDHSDVERSLASLGLALKELGRLDEALKIEERAIRMLTPNSELLDSPLTSRGEILLELGRYREAEVSLTDALKMISENIGASSALAAHPLTALAAVKLAMGDPSTAISYSERALRIREEKESDVVLLADTRFGLARALWEGGGDRSRSMSLAHSARQAYATKSRRQKLSAVDSWLATHRAPARPSRGLSR
jgi:tetratricopeptide (TPR) repeat protein